MNKIDIKSLTIGFLLASCMFLFMGQTTITQKYGDVMKVELVKPFAYSIDAMEVDVNIKDFPYEKLKVEVYD